MGCGDAKTCADDPAHVVSSPSFSIERRRVLLSEYVSCELVGRCLSNTPDIAHDPREMASVTYDRAVEYCAWKGGTVPTATQWEIAARGRTARRFPWGDHWEQRRGVRNSLVNVTSDKLYEYQTACAGEDGASPFGVFDLVGSPELVLSSPIEPQLRGGVLELGESPEDKFRITHIDFGARYTRAGFRCVFP